MTGTITPLVVDLGKRKSKMLRDLKNGRGPLIQDVARTLEGVRANSPELASKELLPVVMIYRKKPKRKRRGMLPFGMMKMMRMMK